MIAPTIPENEKKRLKELESFSILDTLPEEDYDNITSIAAEICGTPISLISLIDDKRQWFKSHHGIDATETPKEYAFCAHAINEPTSNFIVQDARKDERFKDNPLVVGDPHVIFYAGIPLVSTEGLAIGTLCVIDHKPKLLSQTQLNSLKALASQIINLLKLRKTNAALEKTLLKLEEKNQELERFAFIAAHDLKSPLLSISKLAQLVISQHSSTLNTEGQFMLELIDKSSEKLQRLIDGLLDYSRSENMLRENKTRIFTNSLFKDVLNLFSYETHLKSEINSELSEIFANKTILEQILINLISNAIKYNNKATVEIELGLSETNTHYEFYVKDNGSGIPIEYQERIFNIFETISKDKAGNTGNGIGLATVKKIVERSNGTIKLTSKVGKGTRFTFTIGKHMED